MEYLADTVALVRHLAKIGKIGKQAKKLLKEADNGKSIIYISIISLVEIMYLAEKERIKIELEDVKKMLQETLNYKIIDLSIDIVNVAKKIKNLELHDRLIMATAKYLGVPIITSDKEMSASKAVEVIWS